MSKAIEVITSVERRRASHRLARSRRDKRCNAALADARSTRPPTKPQPSAVRVAVAYDPSITSSVSASSAIGGSRRSLLAVLRLILED